LVRTGQSPQHHCQAGTERPSARFLDDHGLGKPHLSQGRPLVFPFEIGAVFTGAPTIALNPTGYACTTQADAAINGPSCVNMATNSTAQANIASQIAKYQKDLNVLTVYPIFSIGLGYNFKIR
jgi:hypothetical protein